MEYTAVRRTEHADIMTGEHTQAAGKERAVSDEPRFVLNARGQAFVADTLGIICDSPLTNTEISLIAEKIEQNLRDTVPRASLLIQLAVVGQTSAEISHVMGMSPATASRYLRAIRRASGAPSLAYVPVNDEVFVHSDQPQAVVEEVAETYVPEPELLEKEIPVEQASEALAPEELPVEQFHSVTAGSLRGGIYRALKEHGVKGYGVIEISRLSELVEAALSVAAVSSADRQSYRGYLQTNKPLFIDNPARSLVADVPKLIAEILVQETATRPVAVEPVVMPPEIVERPPVRTVRRRIGRTAVARTPQRVMPVTQAEDRPRPALTEQLPLDVVTMNKLRGGVFRALHSFGAALPTSLEHDELHTYTQQVLTDKMVAPEVQAAYDTYLRTCTYVRSDTELSRAINAMPEWIAQQIMHERGVAPSAPVQPEVLTGQKELHIAERQRQAAIAAAELEAAHAYLTGTDWERRQALVSVGGDMHWLSLFDSWCNGVDPETIAAESRHDVGMVRRQLLHMAKAAHREQPAVVAAAPSDDWMKDALCVQTDPEIFFPEKGGSTRDAKKICGQCAVRASCGTYADYQKEGFGVWGERSTKSRKRQLPISAR